MATPIRMPDIGTTVEEFKIMSWLIREGDPVRLGDELVEIETDKAVTALESTAEGVLLRQVAQEGAIACTGDILAYVGQPGEAIPDETPKEQDVAAAPSAAPQPAVAPAGGSAERVAPVVRNLAAKLGIDLALIQGSGPSGVITREDVLRAGKSAPAPAGQSLSRGQAAVARAVAKSWAEKPHIFMTASIDMTAAQAVRAQSGDLKISYDAIFLHAMARALAEMPLLGSRLDGEKVVPPAGIHLALAISAGDDLYLPVIRDVDGKSLPALQKDITGLVEQARANNLRAEQLSGGCMALSNLGMFPIESFDPIIFPEHSAILAVGTIERRPIVIDDRVAIRPLVTARLAVDHRLINGKVAAAFISQIKEIVETDL
ncbi:MAG: dihydrolipoamide acetyltransferase family protein [Armatimonadota bacterium]